MGTINTPPAGESVRRGKLHEVRARMQSAERASRKASGLDVSHRGSGNHHPSIFTRFAPRPPISNFLEKKHRDGSPSGAATRVADGEQKRRRAARLSSPPSATDLAPSKSILSIHAIT